MTIERLEPLARQPHRLKIHLSDGSALTTQDYVAADLGLYPGKVLEEQDYQALLEAISLAAAKNRAVPPPGTPGRTSSGSWSKRGRSPRPPRPPWTG